MMIGGGRGFGVGSTGGIVGVGPVVAFLEVLDPIAGIVVGDEDGSVGVPDVEEGHPIP